MSYFNNLLQKNLKIKDALLLIVFVLIAFFIIRLFKKNSTLFNEAAVRCDTCGIGITDLVRRVKKELLQLEDSMTRNNENAMFKLKDLEMDISFEVRQTQSGKAGGSYEVVTVEGSTESSNEKVQKLILHWYAEELNKDKGIIVKPKPLNNFIDSIKNLHK
jgi:hypothetical protein